MHKGVTGFGAVQQEREDYKLITSSSNNQVKNLIQLKKKAKERTRQDVFLVEGPKMFLEVPENSLVKVYLSESFYNKNKQDPRLEKLMSIGGGDVLTDSVFEAISDTKTPQGVVCLVKQFHYKEADLLGNSTSQTAVGKQIVSSGKKLITTPNVKLAKKPALVMVLENIQDPGNLGTILRTAEGAGVTGILMSADTVDLYNPKVIRSTMGSVYRMPFLYTDNLSEVLKRWRDNGMMLCAAHLQGSVCYDQADYRKDTAFLIGNESRGLTEEISSLANQRIKIPMLGKVESLNAAVASSILMYEAARQRRG